MSVLTVGAIGVAIATSLLLLGIGSSRTSFAVEQMTQARALADSCVEEALATIRVNTSFTGVGTIALGSSTCGYNVANTGGSNRTITATGTVDMVVRKVKVLLDGVSPITITSWQEVADF